MFVTVGWSDRIGDPRPGSQTMGHGWIGDGDMWEERWAQVRVMWRHSVISRTKLYVSEDVELCKEECSWMTLMREYVHVSTFPRWMGHRWGHESTFESREQWKDSLRCPRDVHVTKRLVRQLHPVRAHVLQDQNSLDTYWAFWVILGRDREV